MIFETIQRADGQWWVKCADEKCDSKFATLSSDPDSVKIKSTNVIDGRMHVEWEAYIVCAECFGEVCFERVAIQCTVTKEQ